MDAWGGAWGSNWSTSWTRTTPIPVVVIDTHDEARRFDEYKRKREELRAQIEEAFEEITGTKVLPTVAEIRKAQKAQPAQIRLLERVKEDVDEYEEINQSLFRLSKMLQEREMDDIAFIASIL